MADLSSWSLEDIGRLVAILAGIATILGLVVAGVWKVLTRRVDHWKEALANPESLRDLQPHFNDFSLRNRYRRGLGRALDTADWFFGPKISWRAYGLCLSFAFFYPIVLFIITWVLGGPHTLGTVEVLPKEWSAAARIAFVVGLTAYTYTVYEIFAYFDDIVGWINRTMTWTMPRCGVMWRRGVLGTVTGLLGGFMGYVITGAPTHTLVLAGVFAVAGTVTGAPAVAGAIAGGFAVAGAGVMAGAPAVAGAVAGVFVVAVAFTISFVVAVAVAVAVAIVGYFAEGWISVFAPETMSFLLFLVILPLLNAALDMLSWAVSRWLGRELLARNFRWKGVVVFATLDIGAVLILLGGLAFLLGLVGEAVDLLAAKATGSTVLDLDMIVGQVTAEPFGDGLWITLMLCSTIVPTAIHAMVASGSAFQIWAWKEQREEWREEVNEKVEEKEGLDNLRTRDKIAWYWAFWAWIPPITILAALTILLVWQLPYLPNFILDAVNLGRSLVG